MSNSSVPELTLILPVPPSVNTLWGRSKNGVTYLKTEGKVYYRRTTYFIFEQRGHSNRVDYDAIDIYYFKPDNRVRDLDNITKATLDVLKKAAVIVEDSHFHSINLRFGRIVKGGLIIVKLRREMQEFISPDDLVPSDSPYIQRATALMFGEKHLQRILNHSYIDSRPLKFR